MSMIECSGGWSSLGHALKWKRVSLRVWLECWREGRRWQGGEAGHRITLPLQQVSAGWACVLGGVGSKWGGMQLCYVTGQNSYEHM